MQDVIIIGGGISGFTAALFLARRGLKVQVLGKDIGGQANFTDLIENFPGLPEVGGFELVSTVQKQAENFGAEFLEAEVSHIKKVGEDFIVTAYGKQYKARAIVLAFGKTPRDLGVLGEQEFKGRGVTYCASCDAPLYKKQSVAVVGIGDQALEAALLCAKPATRVYLLSKTNKLIGHPALLSAIKRKKNIELVPFVTIDAIVGTDRVAALKLIDNRTESRRDLPVTGVFVELGYVVKSDFLQGFVELDDLGQIIVGLRQEASVEGVFAAGDATNREYKQAVISAGDAALAALACYDWLMHKQGGRGMTSDWTQIKRIKK